MKKDKRLKTSLIRIPVIIILTTVGLILISANLAIQDYIARITGKFMEQRFGVLDAYYNDEGYEGYYPDNSEYRLYVYHIILDKDNNILFPYEEYEEETAWNRVLTISKKYSSQSIFSGDTGKIRIDEQVYFYKTKIYKGEFDGFFITQNTQHEQEYVVLVYSNISAMDEFLQFISIVLVVQMILSVIVGLVMVLYVTCRIDESFKMLTDYIMKAERKEKLLKPANFYYCEFNKIAHALFCMSKMVERAEKRQESFFQNASHELRTPLMSIQGYAEGIVYDSVDDHKMAASVIIKNSEKMSKLVEEILYLSKMEMDKELNQAKVIDVRDILMLCASLIEGEAEGKGLTLGITLEEKEMLVWGNEKMLERAFSNILSNALRYAQTKINIIGERHKNEFYIRIQNDGEEIPAEDRPYIFDRFYKGKGGKTGIGLAIVAEAVKKMGGNAEVKSCDDLTEFILTVPVHKEGK